MSCHLFSSAYSVRVAWGCYCILPPFFKWLQGFWPIPVSLCAKARVHPRWVTSSSRGPYWWQRPTHKVPTAHQEQFWSSVSCSRMLWHVAQFRYEGCKQSGPMLKDIKTVIPWIFTVFTGSDSAQPQYVLMYFRATKTTVRPHSDSRDVPKT